MHRDDLTHAAVAEGASEAHVASAICFPPVAYAHNADGRVALVDLVDDAVIANSDAVIVAGAPRHEIGGSDQRKLMESLTSDRSGALPGTSDSQPQAGSSRA